MDDNTKQIEPFSDTNEMIAHLKLSRAKFELLILEGMPMLRIDKSRRFKISEVEEWLRSRNQK
jgi:hypothetical protein